MPGGHYYEGSGLQTERLQGVTSRLMGTTKSAIKGTLSWIIILTYLTKFNQ